MIAENSVNSVLFLESIDWENEQQYIINKRLMIVDVLNFPGCFNAELLAPIPNIRKEWITLIQFQNESSLNTWLNSEEYNQGILRLKAYIKTSKRQFLSNFNQQVSFLITTTVTPENEQEWLKWNDKIHTTMTTFPGFIGSDIQPSIIKQKGNYKTWIINFQFNNLQNLRNWLDSPKRQKLIEEGSKLYESSTISEIPSGFGSWFDFQKHSSSSIAAWKMPFIVEMALYPVVLFQSQLTFLNSWFSFPVVILINTACSCLILQYLFIPRIQKLMNFWLLPKGNQKQKINLIGVVLSLMYLLIICYISVKVI